jgi:hypothetical protein
MADGRPYSSVEALFAASDKVWSQASRSDILEAFEAHPKIGDSKGAAQHGGVSLTIHYIHELFMKSRFTLVKFDLN